MAGTSPAMTEAVLQSDRIMRYRSAADAARFIADESALWGKVIAEAHITAK